MEALNPQLAKKMKNVHIKTPQFFKVNSFSMISTSDSSSMGSGCAVCVVNCLEIGCCLKSVNTFVMVSWRLMLLRDRLESTVSMPVE